MCPTIFCAAGAGMSYHMDFEEEANVREEDAVMEYEGGFRLVCDPKSLLYLFGMEVRPSQQKLSAWASARENNLCTLNAADGIEEHHKTTAPAAMPGSVCHEAVAAVSHSSASQLGVNLLYCTCLRCWGAISWMSHSQPCCFSPVLEHGAVRGRGRSWKRSCSSTT